MSRKILLWEQKLYLRDTGVHVQVLLFTLIALFLTVFTFSYSTYHAEKDQYDTRLLYLGQLNKEIQLNLHYVGIYQDEVAKHKTEGIIPIPIVPFTSVYEAGLQNNNIIRLPPGTQNSLAEAYADAKRITQYSQDYNAVNHDNNDVNYVTYSGLVGAYTDSFKLNLQDVYTRGFYYVYLPADYLKMKLVAYVCLFIIAVIFIYDIASVICNKLIDNYTKGNKRKSKNKN